MGSGDISGSLGSGGILVLDWVEGQLDFVWWRVLEVGLPIRDLAFVQVFPVSHLFLSVVVVASPLALHLLRPNSLPVIATAIFGFSGQFFHSSLWLECCMG